MNITITTEHSASSYGQPVILVDGELQEAGKGVPAAWEAIADIPMPDLISTTLGGPVPTLRGQQQAKENAIHQYVAEIARLNRKLADTA